MQRHFQARSLLVVLIGALFSICSGCHAHLAKQLYQPPGPAAPLGTLSDTIWEQHETNGEASDFVVYQHEFEIQGHRLNLNGRDHVRQVAARLLEGHDFPVIVERSLTTPHADTKYEYPVNENPQLDWQRRDTIARLLSEMGVADADQRVVVAPALTPGFKATEAETSYLQGLRQGLGFGLFGRGFGGFGGGFGLGGFRGFGAGR